MRNNQELDPVKYYDKISSKYESTINSDPDNSKIRDEVKHYFLNNVSGKIVLDFGGGTGNDLYWLFENGFNIYFCEPSNGMRDIALKKMHGANTESNVIILEDLNTDFHNWNKSDNPFQNKVDGILANFAVINSIKDLEELSYKLALISNKNCKLIILVLNINFNRIISSNLPVIIKLLFKGYGFATEVKDENNQMIVYLHTSSKLIKSFKKYFELVESFRAQKSIFRIFHFIRNDKEIV